METIDDKLELGILDVSKAVFFVSEGGFAGLRYKDEEYKHIVLRRTMPIKQPSQYISIADDKNKEIGILRDLAELSPDQLAIVENELDNRYYSPKVLEIISVKDKLGYVYMEMKVKNKKEREYVKNCAVKDVSRNIRMLSDTSLIIFDVDRNRYIVPDLSELDKNSLKRLDSYLF